MESPETEMLVGNEAAWRGGGVVGAIRIPHKTKKAQSDTCKKKEEAAGQEQTELTEWTRHCKRHMPNTQEMKKKIYFIWSRLVFLAIYLP